MCIACSEFIKKSLTLKEYKSALWEVAREDEEHLVELDQIFKSAGNDPEKLRQKLSALPQRPARRL
jgi:rubrerythrin